jgi:hypothetical protein
MRDVLLALNQLVADGVIREYAIGGAVGAAFYIEATQTEDIDAFAVLPPSDSILTSLSPIYAELTAMGGIVEGAHVRFGDWPLQILTDANPLVAEAIAEASSVLYEDVQTRIFRAEHLCAVGLQTGRLKDYLRVGMFLDQNAVNCDVLAVILARFGLTDRMNRVVSSETPPDRG